MKIWLPKTAKICKILGALSAPLPPRPALAVLLIVSRPLLMLDDRV